MGDRRDRVAAGLQRAPAPEGGGHARPDLVAAVRGRLADKAGLQAELAEMDRLWSEEGRFAVHNDVTNCLRHGDLTIPTRLDGPRDVEIAEIKAGGRTKVAQTSRLERKLAFLEAGYRRPGDENDPGARILAPPPACRPTFRS